MPWELSNLLPINITYSIYGLGLNLAMYFKLYFHFTKQEVKFYGGIFVDPVLKKLPIYVVTTYSALLYAWPTSLSWLDVDKVRSHWWTDWVTRWHWESKTLMSSHLLHVYSRSLILTSYCLNFYYILPTNWFNVLSLVKYIDILYFKIFNNSHISLSSHFTKIICKILQIPLNK